MDNAVAAAALPLVAAQHCHFSINIGRVSGLQGGDCHDRVAPVVKQARPVVVGVDVGMDQRHQ